MIKKFIPKGDNKELECLIDISHSLREQNELMQKIIEIKDKVKGNEYNVNSIFNLLIKKGVFSFKEFADQMKEISKNPINKQ